MKYKIPLFDLNFGIEEERSVLHCIRSKWISMGDNVKALEDAFKDYLDVQNAVAVTNCTAALHLALTILGVKAGDEVIVPSLTFVATVNAVRYMGAVPVFADITSNDDLSIDPDDIRSKITDRTKAIIIMHYGGFACDMDAIMNMARNHGLFVIEDVAHAPGSEYKGKKLGTFGNIACFSFFSNKNITCAEGGMLVTDNDEYANLARLLRSHGMTSLSYDRARGHATEYDVIALGYNYRMDDIRGSLALAQLKKLDDDITRRKELRDYYIELLERTDGIIIPYKKHPYRSSNYIFPIILENSDQEKRNKVRQYLANAGIQTSVHYPAVHRFSIYQENRLYLPNTEYVTDNEITLPLYYNLKPENIDKVCEALNNTIRRVKIR